MIDLRKIETPIGLLDAETREALMAHGGPYEVYTLHGWRRVTSWSPATIFGWSGSVVRVAAPAPTPDVWPWDAIADRYSYAARDADGDLTLFSKRPVRSSSCWMIEFGRQGIQQASGHILNITIGTCDWRDSLVVRPGYVEGQQ